MRRIDHSTRLVDGNGTGKDGYTEGNPGVTPATVVTATALNTIQEELAALVESFGGAALSNTNSHQISDLLNTWRKQRRAAADYTISTQARLTCDFGGSAPLHMASGGTVAAPLHVVVGASGNWSLSKDKGISWSALQQAGTQSLFAVAYYPTTSAFVAAGAGQSLQVSNNVVTTWTAQTPAGGFTGTFYDVTHYAAGAKMVVVGTTAGGAGAIHTYAGGTWTAQTVPAGTTALRQLAVNDTTIVAVGGATADGRIVKSVDATTWTTAATISGAGLLKYVTYHPALGLWFVASDTDIWKSADLTTWTHMSLVLDSGHLYSGLVALDQALVAFHYHGSLTNIGCQAKFSPDGINLYAIPGFGGAGGNSRPCKIYQCHPDANTDVRRHYGLWISNLFSANHTQSQWCAPTGLL